MSKYTIFFSDADIALKDKIVKTRNLILRILAVLTAGVMMSACGRLWGGVARTTLIAPGTGPGSGGSGASVASFSYTCGTSLIHVLNTAVTDTPTVGSGGGPATYTVSPALPTGLSLNSSTGTISGTPTAAVAATNYTITATGADGSTQSSIINLRTAQGFLVNDLSDLHSTGGATCTTASATCTFRAAVEATNFIGSSRVILLPAGTVSLSLGVVTTTKGMEIYGGCQTNTILDGLSASSILDVQAGPTNISNVTIQNGSVFNNSPAGLEVEAPSAANTTTLSNVIIKNNTITGGSSGASNGAGILVGGTSAVKKVTLNMNNCVVSGNVNNATGGDFGGGITFYNYAQSTITNTLFSGNQSAVAGGAISILMSNVTVSISQSLFYNNSSLPTPGEGGAIFLNSGAGTLSLSNTTFVSNSAVQGGAILNQGGGTTLTVLNSTFANNASDTGYGGAIGGLAAGAGTFQNSIFSHNTSNGVLNHCSGAGGFSVTSSGHNVSDDSSGDCSLTGTGDIVSSATINLGPLQDNGGFTNTMALLTGSSALLTGSTGACPATDQRGVSRRLPTSCDIGAYEH